MKTSILGILLSLLFYPQPIWAESSDNNKGQPKNITGIRVEHKTTIKFIYNNNIYTVYATSCSETINKYNKDLNYIILSPGDPVELKDESGNILILYSLPCN